MVSTRLAVILLLSSFAQGPLVTPAPAQIATGGPAGRESYLEACASCHGPDGRGLSPSETGLEIPLPDFTDCNFAHREPDGDWLAVMHEGGPARGFSPIMPAFGSALAREELEAVLAYVRSFCGSTVWPRGDLNFPLALVTEKAFPEDEAVFKTFVAADGPGEVAHKLIYEKRFGSRTQLELVVPFGWQEKEETPGDWAGGLRDVAVGVKRVLFHSLESGTIVSVTGEAILPTGDESQGFGKGTTVLEPFLAMGQAVGSAGFVQVQTGLELPADRDKAGREAFGRVVLGRTFTEGEWGRAWSPMIEALAARELGEEGAVTQWDLVPQMQVSLNTRQHILANLGLRLPVNEREGRHPQILFYLLWDWFDGGLGEGW